MKPCNRGASNGEGLPTRADAARGDRPLLHQGLDRGGSSTTCACEDFNQMHASGSNKWHFTISMFEKYSKERRK